MNFERRPLYVDVYNKLSEYIIEQKLIAGDKIPAEIELAKMYNVSRGTVRQALLLLRENGIIYNVQGSGNFIAENINKVFTTGLESLKSIPISFSKEELNGEIFNLIYGLPNKHFKSKANVDVNSIIVDIHKRFFNSKGNNVGYTLSMISVYELKLFGIDLEDKEKVSAFIEDDVYKISSSTITNIVFSETGEFLSELFNVEQGTSVITIEEEFYNQKGEFFLLKRHSLLPNNFKFIIKRS